MDVEQNAEHFDLEGMGNLQVETAAKTAFFNFLDSWVDADAEQGSQSELYYAHKVQLMRQEDTNTLFIDWAHFNEYNAQIAEMVAKHYFRLEPVLRKALLEFVRKVQPEHVQVGAQEGEGGWWDGPGNLALQPLGGGLVTAADWRFNFCASVHVLQEDEGNDKEFYLSIYNLPAADKLRDLRCVPWLHAFPLQSVFGMHTAAQQQQAHTQGRARGHCSRRAYPACMHLRAGWRRWAR